MKEELRRTLWPKGPRPDIWAIVDTAQDQKIYWTLTNSFLRYSCLFAGAIPQALEMAAPYLVQLDSDDKFTTYLAENMGRSLGIFLQCDTSIEDLRKHLRTILAVKTIQGRRMLFRYYDPRVMRVYLPTCDASELDQVFGPVKAIWTEGTNRTEFIQFARKGKQLLVTPQSLGIVAVEAAGEMLAPAIVPAQSVLVVQKGGAPRPRVPILLQGAGRGGRLRVSPRGFRIFRTAVSSEELPTADGTYVIPGGSLEPDVTVYAEAGSPCDAVLTLEPAQGGQVETKMMSVSLTLDGGAEQVCVGVRNTPYGTRRRIDVLAPEPASYKGRLQLRTAAGGPEITLYTSESETTGHVLAEGFTFDSPEGKTSFWLEGAAPSSRPGDAVLQLLADGVGTIGDAREITCVEMEPFANGPIVLLSGSLDETAPFQLEARVKPSGVTVHWVAQRADDDGEKVRALSAKPSPTVAADGGHATLLADAAGTFRVSATAGDVKGWGGPAAELELTLVHAALKENDSAINGRFCACARVAGSDRFRLHSGKADAVRLSASVILTGGGPGGSRGLDAVRGGWVNNIMSDNGGARYKGGREIVTRVDEGPVLDAPGDSLCMAGSPPAGQLTALPGEPCWFEAAASPEIARPVHEGGAVDRPIEQLWRYLDCRSFLALWTTGAPDRLGVLVRTGWSFTGDYTCNTTKTVRTIVPARLAATGSTEFPALTPASKAGLETMLGER